MLDRLARFLHRRRRPVLAGAFVLVIVAGVIGGPVAGLLQSDDDFDPPAAEAVQAREAIATATGASASPDVIALVRLGAPAGSAAGQAKLGEVVAAARGPEVARVDAYAPGGPRELVSRDGRSSYVAVSLRDGADSEPLVERLERVPAVTLGGPELINEQAGAQVEEDLARAEMLAFPLLFLVSLVVFRGLVAALLPLFVGMITVLSTFLLMRGVNGIAGMSVFALNLIIGLGLGLAIDYSLFVVSRFREELAQRRADGRRPVGDAADRGPDGDLQRRDRRRRARLAARVPAALPVLDGRGRRAGHGGGGRGLAGVPARAARRARAAGERAVAQAVAPCRRARRRRRARGLLVPALAPGDAAAGRDRRRHRGAADRARAAVHRDQVHRRRRERARHVALGARGRRRAAGGVPAQPHVARDRRRAGAGVRVGRGAGVRARG